MLNAQVCNLAISIGHRFLTLSLPLLLLLSLAHACTRSLGGVIREPIGRGYAEVGAASLLIPPLEWITKWKGAQGSQVDPDQLTAPCPSLSQTPLYLQVLNPHQASETPIYSSLAFGCLNPPVVVVSILESFSSIAVHHVHSLS